MPINALEDVLSDLLGGVVVDPHRQGKRTEGGFFGFRFIADPTVPDGEAVFVIDGEEVGRITNLEGDEK